MTPILRRSKESARRQRSRPESERSQDVPHTRPLASDRSRPLPSYENRKRSIRSDTQQHQSQSRPKYRRQGSPPPRREIERDQPPPRRGSSHRSQNQTREPHHRGRPQGQPVSRSYEDYVRSMRSGGAGEPARSSRGGGHYDDYDDYLYERRPPRASYERSVDEFLRRTGDHPHKRYRDRH